MVLERNIEDTMDKKKKDLIELMEEAGQSKSLVNRIRRRRAVFTGHLMRRYSLDHRIIIQTCHSGLPQK